MSNTDGQALDMIKGLIIVREAYALRRAAGHAAAVGAINAVIDVCGESDPAEAVRLIRQVLAAGREQDGGGTRG
jgi:acid phosphatase family membrane protein YuiD